MMKSFSKFRASDHYFMFQNLPLRMSIILIDATTREVFKDENVVDQDDSKNFILIKLYIYNENSIVKPTKLRLIYWWLCWWLNSIVWRVWWIQQVEDPLQHLPPQQGAVGEEHGRRKIQVPTLLSTMWSPYTQSEKCRRAEILFSTLPMKHWVCGTSWQCARKRGWDLHWQGRQGVIMGRVWGISFKGWQSGMGKPMDSPNLPANLQVQPVHVILE